MDDGRGFTLSHQRVVLDVDLVGLITGTAHLTINPTSPALRTIYLHASSRFQITSVTLASATSTDPLLTTPVSYTLCQPFQPLPSREPPLDIRSHTEIKRKTWAAISERDEGELGISVSGGWVRLIHSDDQTMSLAPIDIQISYHLALGEQVIEGIVFSNDETPHMFLSPTTYDAARIWTPCVDTLWDRCTWELEFIVPTHLPGHEIPVSAICTGELIEQITHPHSPNKTIFYYMQTTPTSVQHVSFAIGPFEMHVIAETPKPMLGFCLPGDLDLVRNSTAFLPRAMAFYSTEFGSYPFAEFKTVFISNARTLCSTAATMCVASVDLLYPPTVIDQGIETRQVLSLALVQQWVGINIIQRALSDTWIINGLALYLNSLFLRHLLGGNEYRFRLKKDIERCVRLDRGGHWPICMPGSVEPPDISFINLKAPLVLHILDRHMAKAGTSLGLSRILPRLFLAALSDELPGNLLSTQFFFKTCRKVSGIDLQTFQDQWVFGSGCPHFRLRTNFIRKKFTVELHVNEVIPAEASTKRPTPFFDGSLTVRIHEADGAPFEHVVDIKSAQKIFNLPFNTKYKRTRRSGHLAARFRKLQADLAIEDEAEEQVRDTDRAETFVYLPWEDEGEREQWKVADWTDEQAEMMLGEGGGYEWIRIDPDCEWLASFEFTEKPWYWISQLQSDRDVVAQLEAVQNMALHASTVVASELARTILVTNYFYRVRMEAARALVNFSTAECEYIGLFYLLKIFQHFYSISPGADPLTEDLAVEKNEFSDMTEYFLKRAIISALGDLRDPTNRSSWRNVRRLLLNILRSNDNTSNKFSDAYYIATIISAIGNAFSASDRNEVIDQQLLREATEGIDRAVTMDRLVPSYRNVVSHAGLTAHLKLIMAGHVTNNPRRFLGYTREGNYESLRILAFDCLLVCRPPGRDVEIDTYLADVVRNDTSLALRRHVARALSEAILLALALGEVAASATAPSIVDITNDTDQAREQRSEAHNGAIVKALRKEFSKKLELRDTLQAELLLSFMGDDDEIRFALIKVAEITTSSVQEPLPGNLITIQTPVMESPAGTTPRIRLSMSGASGVITEADGYGFPSMEQPQPVKVMLGTTAVPQKKNPHKSQARGLPDADRAAIVNAIKKLSAQKTSHLFRQPVDPVRDMAPNYLSIIKQPMDLSTALAKLENGMYSSRQEFVTDIRMIVKNCLTYNAVGTPVYKSGETFEAYFNNLWSRTEATLSTTAGNALNSQISGIPPERASPIPKARAVQAAPSAPQPAPAPIKFKLKPPKSVTIDTTPTELVPPMAPPPLPPMRKQSITLSMSQEQKRKRKESSRATNDLDEVLGNEVDAIAREHRPDAALEGLLEPRPKKAKLPAANLKSSMSATPPPIKTPSTVREAPPAAALSSETAEITSKKLHSSLTSASSSIPLVASASPDPAPVPPQIAPFALPPYERPSPPSDLLPTAGNSMPFKQRRARHLVTLLTKDTNSLIFLKPVDPIADHCPTYLNEISEPMDLGTIAKKIDRKRYTTMGQLAYDIELIFANCRQFNNPGDGVFGWADGLEAAYWREWPKAVSPKMLSNERKDILGLLNKALKDPNSVFFREAVDPVLLGIPQYFQIIPQEDARDLSFIKSKVDKGEYTTARQVDDDVELMLENARVFNEEGPVVEAANAFGQWWQAQREKMD